MQTISATAALLLLALTGVQSAPQISIPGLDGDGDLTIGVSLPTPTNTTTAIPDPTPTIITADPSNCESDPEACDEAINNDPNRPPICFADDPGQADSVCIPYCQKTIGSDPLVQQGGLSSTCLGAPGNCICRAAQFEGQALIAIGEVACFAVDEAIAWSEELLKDIGKLSGESALKWASEVLTIGANVVA